MSETASFHSSGVPPQPLRICPCCYLCVSSLSISFHAAADLPVEPCTSEARAVQARRQPCCGWTRASRPKPARTTRPGGKPLGTGTAEEPEARPVGCGRGRGRRCPFLAREETARTRARSCARVLPNPRACACRLPRHAGGADLHAGAPQARVRVRRGVCVPARSPRRDTVCSGLYTTAHERDAVIFCADRVPRPQMRRLLR